MFSEHLVEGISFDCSSSCSRTIGFHQSFIEVAPLLDSLFLTLFTLFVGFAVWGLFFAWSLIHRFRITWLERELRAIDLDRALDERRAERDDV